MSDEQQQMPWAPTETPPTPDVRTQRREGLLTAGMVAVLAQKLGWPGALGVEGCLVRDLGNDWIVALNGHDETIDCTPEGTMGWKVEPYHIVLWHKGWMVVDTRPFVKDGVTQEYVISVWDGERRARAYLEELLKK